MIGSAWKEGKALVGHGWMALDWANPDRLWTDPEGSMVPENGQD